MTDQVPNTEANTNLHLDEVTGEKVSKTELKKRQKQRKKQEEKLEREAAAPVKIVAAKSDNTEADEKKLNPNVCHAPRPVRRLSSNVL
ncbi:Bgt-3167 [Blumeria graminis f. sp. tritici]|uniref:Lysyl-tRNA synthetase n=2 Tax=Blumeria graminis f. sp. tritici TaxID=62690 RepID=A0A656KFD4_BLUGR|nr:Lysyl-tRNA synthetase [Blumeria graminis f. sp. tritici 96224]VCU40794.1 Bgt-3167 [Blumeria graminis f. sp. tritici]